MHRAPARPSWLVRRIPAGFGQKAVPDLLAGLRLHTVCQSADCPNLGECFASGTATFLILGPVCTRRCRFCAVAKGTPALPDPAEPARLAEAVRRLNLSHAVITSVTRDDLPDGGAGHFAACIRELRQTARHATVEVLVPDFAGSANAVDLVLSAGPDVLNHNVETVPRLYPEVRPGARWERSLGVLGRAAASGSPSVKSGLMVGLGETDGELAQAFAELAGAGVDTLTVGQYLPPDASAAPVRRWVRPEDFAVLAEAARTAGIPQVQSGPLVRSSYRAGEVFHRTVSS